jgi:hypothetical protein
MKPYRWNSVAKSFFRPVVDATVSSSIHTGRETSILANEHDVVCSGQVFFWVRSCLYVKSDSVPICTETVFIFQVILRANSDSGASRQFDRRPMALPYPYRRRLEVLGSSAVQSFAPLVALCQKLLPLSIHRKRTYRHNSSIETVMPLDLPLYLVVQSSVCCTAMLASCGEQAKLFPEFLFF